jgi:hypothetical protein
MAATTCREGRTSRPAMASQARVSVSRSGRYQVSIAAVDIGTGARTVLLATAAEALGVPASAIDLLIGDSALPPAMIAGGSMGTASWTWAVIKACRSLREQVRARDGAVPPGGSPRTPPPRRSSATTPITTWPDTTSRRGRRHQPRGFLAPRHAEHRRASRATVRDGRRTGHPLGVI